jgi:hypothetical protein
MALHIPAGELDEWLTVLKPYQRNTIKSFLLTDAPEKAAERWLGATGSPNIVPFGGAKDTKPFWTSSWWSSESSCAMTQLMLRRRKSCSPKTPSGRQYS